MDNSLGLIADYVHTLRFSDLPAAVVHHCKRCMIDTFGCAMGGFSAEQSRIARAMALRASQPAGARVIGLDHRTLPELAAFANGAMARYLDANDGYVGSGGHPSDSLAAIIAAADIKGADGRTFITAMAAAYEIYHKLWKAVRLRDKGMDNVFYTVVAGAVGAAKVLRLDRAHIADAVSLAITPNVALDATRYGHLSIWKGCAGPNAARNGVFAALLAAAGMTGPEMPIEGGHGMQNLFGEKFELMPFGGDGRAFGINEITFKRFSAVAHAQSPITAALPLSRQVRAEDIASVTVYTYKGAVAIAAGEPEKWRPTTREAADHSIPYIVATVLMDGGFSNDSYSEEKLCDPRILQLMDKIEVKEDPEHTRQFSAKLPSRIEVTTKSGERKVSATEYARGHYNNAMSDDEVSAKFRDLAKGVLPPDRIERALTALWQLDTAPGLDALFAAVKVEA